MHDFAIKLGTVNESQHEEDQQATLKRLELLLITDVSITIGTKKGGMSDLLSDSNRSFFGFFQLAVPDRQYIRHDMVQIMVRVRTTFFLNFVSNSVFYFFMFIETDYTMICTQKIYL